MSTVEIRLPVTEVTVLEDRAHVTRTGPVILDGDRVRLVVVDVSPVIVDKTVHVRLAGGTARAAVEGTRVVRRLRASDAARPELTARRELAVREAEAAVERWRQTLAGRRRELGALERLESLALSELLEDVAWSRAAFERTRAHLAVLTGREAEATARAARLCQDLRDAEQALDRARREQSEAESPEDEVAARLEIDLRVTTPGDAVLAVAYVTPGACWRPCHTAVLDEDGPAPVVRLTSEGCVWQRTGEAWTGVTLRLSTERLSLGTEPPRLRSDVLVPQKKASADVVAERDQEIQDTGPEGAPEARSTASLPGIDDGGEALLLLARGPADLPSDGRPHRFAVAEAELPAEVACVLLPELAPVALDRSVQRNATAAPLLAGPVELIRHGGRIGRTPIRFVAPGASFELGWGPEAALRVHREEEAKDLEAGLLSGWQARRHRVTVRVSNVGAGPVSVTVRERLPVSEVPDLVTVELEPDATTGMARPDANGFVEWPLGVAPGEPTTLTLGYLVKRRKSVAGM
jgi:uncharacterized protein (TIGR02231 family)